MRTNFTSSALRLAILRAESFIQQTVGAGRSIWLRRDLPCKIIGGGGVQPLYPPRRKIFDLDVRSRVFAESQTDRSNFLLHFAFMVEAARESLVPRRRGMHLSAAEVSPQRELRTGSAHVIHMACAIRVILLVTRQSPAWTNALARAISARHACISDCGGASFPDACTSPPQMAELKSRIDRRDGCETSKKSSGVAVVRLVRMPAAGRVLRLRS